MEDKKTNNTFSKKVLEKLKKDEIKQIPKIFFVFKNTLFWVFLVLSIILWSISLAISFEYLFNADWSLVARLWPLKIFSIFAPVFWIVFLMMSVFSTYYNFRHTKKWYKYSFMLVFFSNLVLSIVLSLFFYFVWFNNIVETSFERSIPHYRSMLVKDKISRMEKVWQNEGLWLLLWKINRVWTKDFDLIDNNNKNWVIIIDNDTNLKTRADIIVWAKIKIIWEKIADDMFKAEEIRPFIWKR